MSLMFLVYKCKWSLAHCKMKQNKEERDASYFFLSQALYLLHVTHTPLIHCIAWK